MSRTEIQAHLNETPYLPIVLPRPLRAASQRNLKPKFKVSHGTSSLASNALTQHPLHGAKAAPSVYVRLSTSFLVIYEAHANCVAQPATLL